MPAAAPLNWEQLLNGEDTFATTLLIVLIDRFGDEMINNENGVWTPQTIRDEVVECFSVKLTDAAIGKVMAAASIITTDKMRSSLPSFLTVAHGLLGDGSDWYYAEPIDVEDLAWCLTEAMLLYPVSPDAAFDPQIVGYVQEMLKREGMLFPPSILRFADPDADRELGAEDEDIVRNQIDRTNAVQEYIDVQLQKMLNEVLSLNIASISMTQLVEQVKLELQEVASQNKWY
jgi:hypothetical protein